MAPLLLAERLYVCGPTQCHLAGISSLPVCATPGDLKSQGPSSLHSRTLPDLKMTPLGPPHLSTRCPANGLCVFMSVRETEKQNVLNLFKLS